MVQNIFFQTDYKIILHLYQLKNILLFFGGTSNIYSWTFKGMLEESVENPSTPDNSFVPNWIDDYRLSEVKLLIRQDSVSS